MKGTFPLNIDSAIIKLKDRADGIYYLVDKRKEYHNTLSDEYGYLRWKYLKQKLDIFHSGLPLHIVNHHTLFEEKSLAKNKYSTVKNDTTGILEPEQIEELKNHLNNALVEDIDFNTVLSLRIHEYDIQSPYFLLK
jgi:hypothetical protein